MRRIAAWLVIPALISLYLANQNLIKSYPSGAIWMVRDSGMPRPSLFVWLLWWRNTSFLLALAASLISLPRWQSVLGIVGLILFMYLYGGG